MADEREPTLEERERDARRQDIKLAIGAAIALMVVVGIIAGIVYLAMP